MGYRIAGIVLALAALGQVGIASADLKPIANPGSMPVNAPVSIVRLAEEQFVFADYRNLYSWSPGIGARVLSPTFGGDTKLDIVWNPTGVYADKGDIYVANYQGHNILIGRSVDGAGFRIDREITHPDLVSPENVAVAGDFIAVADYDASAVFLFNKRGDLLWKRAGITFAHGVAILDDAIYVTALGDRKLLKLDLAGNILAENNAAGWDDLLYPTSVAAMQGGDIAVLDANRGTLVIYDRNLRKIRAMGRNAPDMFKRPYGFAVAGDRVLVADTGNHRLVWLAPDGTIESVAVVLDHVMNIGTPPRWGHGYAYCSYGQTGFDLGVTGYAVFTGFATLCLYRDDVLQQKILLPYERLDGTGLRRRPVNGFTFAWSASVNAPDATYQVIGSFDRSMYLVQRGTDYVLVQGLDGVSVWGAAGAEPFLLSVVERARGEFKAGEDEARQCSPVFAFFHRGDFVKPTFDETLIEALYSATAKMAAAQWLADTPISLSADQLVAAELTSVDDLRIILLLERTHVDRERALWQRCRERFGDSVH